MINLGAADIYGNFVDGEIVEGRYGLYIEQGEQLFEIDKRTIISLPDDKLVKYKMKRRFKK